LLQEFLIEVAELHEFPDDQYNQIHTLLREVNFMRSHCTCHELNIILPGASFMKTGAVEAVKSQGKQHSNKT
jgi:hypothetical protein